MSPRRPMATPSFAIKLSFSSYVPRFLISSLPAFLDFLASHHPVETAHLRLPELPALFHPKEAKSIREHQPDWQSGYLRTYSAGRPR